MHDSDDLPSRPPRQPARRAGGRADRPCTPVPTRGVAAQGERHDGAPGGSGDQLAALIRIERAIRHRRDQVEGTSVTGDPRARWDGSLGALWPPGEGHRRCRDHVRRHKLIASNRRARRDYELLDVVEAGVVLTGSEVKSLRLGHVQLADGFARWQRRTLVGVHISPYQFATEPVPRPEPPASRSSIVIEIDRLQARRPGEAGPRAAEPVLPRRPGQGRASPRPWATQGRPASGDRRAGLEREIDRALGRIPAQRSGASTILRAGYGRGRLTFSPTGLTGFDVSDDGRGLRPELLRLAKRGTNKNCHRAVRSRRLIFR